MISKLLIYMFKFVFEWVAFYFYKPDPSLSDLEDKQRFFFMFHVTCIRRRWYYKHHPDYKFKAKLRSLIKKLAFVKIRSKMLNLVRWVIIDFLRGKMQRHWGIYCYVANKGEGKTISMVAHMERAIKEIGRENLYIVTNFDYLHEDGKIVHWIDMIRAVKYAKDHKLCCIIGMDEIHITFDASDWKSFPDEMLALLSFVRKDNVQFLCSAQSYDRIPKKIQAVADYVVLCKNSLDLDRHFKNFYYKVVDYDVKFDGKRKNAHFIRTFVAGDDVYSLYDTKKRVDKLLENAKQEKDKKQEAFELLFGNRVEGSLEAG